MSNDGKRWNRAGSCRSEAIRVKCVWKSNFDLRWLVGPDSVIAWKCTALPETNLGTHPTNGPQEIQVGIVVHENTQKKDSPRAKERLHFPMVFCRGLLGKWVACQSEENTGNCSTMLLLGSEYGMRCIPLFCGMPDMPHMPM